MHLTSDRERAYAALKFPKFPSAVIPNGVSAPQTVDRKCPSDAIRLSYLGRLHPIKGLDTLMRACREVRDIRWTLKVAGNGDDKYRRELVALCEREGISKDVSFVGPVEGEQGRARLFAETDLFVLPSYSENFGMVVSEALAHGVPVLTTTGTPWRDLEAMQCGLCVDPTIEDLANGIRKAVSMPLRQMGERGRQWMIESFQWSTVAGQMSTLYERMRDLASRGA
jgi:glycosyltransferase involved in cell wall biosynthesis